MTRYFLATQVVDCQGTKFFALAIVGENGAEFYGEAKEPEETLHEVAVNGFASSQVGRRQDSVISSVRLLNDVSLWMWKVPDGCRPVLCYRFGEDRQRLEQLLGDRFPKHWRMEAVRQQLDAQQHEAYFIQVGATEEHALHHARANLYAFTPLRLRPKTLPWVVSSLADLKLGDDVHAVIFDAFGTLCRIPHPSRPFLRLFNLGEKRKFWPTREIVMTRPWDIREAAAALRFDPRPGVIEALESALATELASIELFSEVPGVLAGLRERGIKVAVASNLAKPYAAPLLALLPSGPDVFAWSFEVGYLKPDRRIFHWTCERLGVPPENALMIGDSLRADYQGARSAGLQAIHLRRQTERDNDVGRDSRSQS